MDQKYIHKYKKQRVYHAPMRSVSEKVATEQQSCILTRVTSPSAYALHSESM